MKDWQKLTLGLSALGAAVIGVALATREEKVEAAPPPPPPPGLANLYGVVQDVKSGQPVSGVLVVIGTTSTSTDAAGSFKLESLTPGDYTVVFSKEGYRTVNSTITIVEGNIELNVKLEKSGLETWVMFNSIPSGADIYIDGALAGKTPKAVTLQPGPYAVIFKLAGYQDYVFPPFTLTGEYSSTTLGATLAPIPPPATPRLTFGQLTGSYFTLYGGFYPILKCRIANNSNQAIAGRDILAFFQYTSPNTGLPVGGSGSITDTTKVYGVPAYGPAPGLISLQPGQSINIDWAPNFSIPRDVVNSLWLQDTVTGDKSNVITLP